MTPRELIILLLGFLMVAVLLRGLFVAIQVRRGQIRLTIDKSIPQDFDFEELELAELPSGGARVVDRTRDSHPWASQVGGLSGKLDSFETGSESPIPILMDIVESDEFKVSESLVDRDQEISKEETQSNYDDPINDLPSDRDRNAGIETHSWEHENLEVPQPGLQTDRLNDVSVSTREYGDDISVGGLDIGDYETSFSDELGVDERDQSSSFASLTERECLSDNSEDYPEKEWYEDEEVTKIPDGLLKETFSDSREYDNLNSLEDKFENMQTANLGGVAESVENELDSDGTQEQEDCEQFSMTAGERIGFQESRIDSNLGTDFLGEPETREKQSSIKKRALVSFFSIFRSKPENKRPAKKEFDSEQHKTIQERLDTETEQTELIEEIEDFIDQSEEHFKTPANYTISEADIIGDVSENEGSEEEISISDNVTSIEDASGGGRPVIENSQAKPKVVQPPININPMTLLTMSIMSPAGGKFFGEDLIRAFKRARFEYGEMGIFHLFDGVDNTSSLVCSAANALNPGTFDLDEISGFSTVGVSLFLTLPASGNNLRAFEQMLSAAQQLGKDLGGELKDDHRSDLTAQTIEHYRQRIRDFELDQLRVAGGRG